MRKSHSSALQPINLRAHATSLHGSFMHEAQECRSRDSQEDDTNSQHEVSHKGSEDAEKRATASYADGVPKDVHATLSKEPEEKPARKGTAREEEAGGIGEGNTMPVLLDSPMSSGSASDGIHREAHGRTDLGETEVRHPNDSHLSCSLGRTNTPKETETTNNNNRRREKEENHREKREEGRPSKQTAGVIQERRSISSALSLPRGFVIPPIPEVAGRQGCAAGSVPLQTESPPPANASFTSYTSLSYSSVPRVWNEEEEKFHFFAGFKKRSEDRTARQRGGDPHPNSKMCSSSLSSSLSTSFPPFLPPLLADPGWGEEHHRVPAAVPTSSVVPLSYPGVSSTVPARRPAAGLPPLLFEEGDGYTFTDEFSDHILTEDVTTCTLDRMSERSLMRSSPFSVREGNTRKNIRREKDREGGRRADVSPSFIAENSPRIHANGRLWHPTLPSHRHTTEDYPASRSPPELEDSAWCVTLPPSGQEEKKLPEVLRSSALSSPLVSEREQEIMHTVQAFQACLPPSPYPASDDPHPSPPVHTTTCLPTTAISSIAHHRKEPQSMGLTRAIHSFYRLFFPSSSSDNSSSSLSTSSRSLPLPHLHDPRSVPSVAEEGQEEVAKGEPKTLPRKGGEQRRSWNGRPTSGRSASSSCIIPSPGDNNALPSSSLSPPSRIPPSSDGPSAISSFSMSPSAFRGPLNADLLRRVFLFVSSDNRRDILAMGATCRFWYYHSNFSPHWTRFRSQDYRSHSKSDWPQLPKALRASLARPTVVTREQYVAERKLVAKYRRSAAVRSWCYDIRVCIALGVVVCILVCLNYLIGFFFGRFLYRALSLDSEMGGISFITAVFLAVVEVVVVIMPLGSMVSAGGGSGGKDGGGGGGVVDREGRKTALVKNHFEDISRALSCAEWLIALSIIFVPIIALAFARVTAANQLLKGSTMDLTSTATCELTNVFERWYPSFAVLPAALTDLRWRPITTDASERQYIPYCIPLEFPDKNSINDKHFISQLNEDEIYCYSLLYFDAHYSSLAFTSTAGYSSRHIGTYTALGYEVFGNCSANSTKDRRIPSTSLWEAEENRTQKKREYSFFDLGEEEAYEACERTKRSIRRHPRQRKESNRCPQKGTVMALSPPLAVRNHSDNVLHLAVENEDDTDPSTYCASWCSTFLSPPVIAISSILYFSLSAQLDEKYPTLNSWTDAEGRPTSLKQIEYQTVSAIPRVGTTDMARFVDLYKHDDLWRTHYFPLVSSVEKSSTFFKNYKKHFRTYVHVCWIISVFPLVIMMLGQFFLRRSPTMLLGVSTVVVLVLLNPLSMILAGGVCVNTPDTITMCSPGLGGVLIGTGLSLCFIVLTIYVSCF